MDKETAKILLPIITAFSEGKEIQCMGANSVWRPGKNLVFNCHPDMYRIKPEPMVIYARICETGYVYVAGKTRSTVEAFTSEGTLKKFIEVQDD